MSRNRGFGSLALARSSSKRSRRLCWPVFEALEERQLLATIDWVSTSSGAWDVASNWSNDTVPGPNDDVVIAVAGATPTVTISSNVESVHSVSSSDPLVISGGGLTVAANSTISGGLAMTGGALTADGTGTSLTVTGTTTVAGASLNAESGATLKLSQLASYASGSGYSTALEATGAGSMLSLPELATITANTNYGTLVQISSSIGGDVELPLLTQATGPVELSSGGGTLGVAHLGTFTGGTIADSGGAFSLPALVNADNTTFQISGGVTLTLPKVNQADAANLEVSGAATLALPILTSYTGGPGFTTTLSATGTGSVLSLPELTTITASTNYGTSVQISSSTGGAVQMPALTQSTGPVTLTSSTGTLGVAALTAFTGGTIAYSGGTMSLPVLANGSNTTFNISSALALPHLATATGAVFQISNAVTLTLPDLTGADGASLEASGGASLTAPILTSYNSGSGYTSTFSATGSGSVLSLPELATITANTNYGTLVQISSSTGGDVELPLLTQATGPVELSSGGGTLGVAHLGTFTGGTIADSGGAFSLPALVNADSTTFQISGGVTLTLPKVNQADAANLEVSGAATLALPILTSYTGGPGFTTTLSATGTGSVLSLPELTTITASTNYGTSVQISSSTGGAVQMPALTQSTGPVTLTSSTGTLGVAALTAFTGGTIAYSGGTMSLPVLANGSNTTFNISSALALPHLATATGAVFQISNAVTLTLPDLTGADGASLEASGGASLTAPILTSYNSGSGYTSTFSATGSGSVLSLPELATITANTNYGTLVQISSSTGGDVELPLLTQATGPVELSSGGGTLGVAHLGTFTGGTIADSGGAFSLPALVNADSTTFQISGGVTLTLPKVNQADAANLEVSGGATLALPILTSYTGGPGFTTTLSATGTGSVLSLPELTTITASTNYGTSVQISSSTGGAVQMPALTQSTGPVTLTSSTGTLGVAALTAFTGGTIAYSGGTMSLPVLANGSNTTFNISSALALPHLATATGAVFQISNGVTMSLPVLTDVDGASLEVSGGASLTLPDVTSYNSGSGYTSTLSATATGSVLLLPNLTTITANTSYATSVQISSSTGGAVEMPKLTQSTGPITLSSSAGTLAVAAVTTFTGGTIAYSGGTMNLPVLATGNNSSFEISSGLSLPDLATASGANFQTSNGVTLILPALTSADGASFEASGGSSLTVPILLAYNSGSGYVSTLSASGTGSILSLPELATIAANTNYGTSVQISSSSSGQVKMPLLTQSTGPVTLSSSTGTLAVPDLATFSGGTIVYSGGTMSLPLLSNASGSTLEISSALSFPDLSNASGATFQISNGTTTTLPAVTEADGASFETSGGSSLNVPLLTSYNSGVGYPSTFQATGSGSILTLPFLASIGANTSYGTLVQVQALAGGDIELPRLAQVTTGPVQLESSGSGSVLDVPILSSFTGSNGGSLTITSGGTVKDPVLSQINGVSLIGDSNGVFPISSSLGFTISGGTSTVQTGTLLDEGDLGVDSGATLNIEAGLSVDGSGILTSAPGSTIEVGGDLLGTTQNADDFNPQGTVAFDSGAGTSNPPQLLEAMSVDMGAVQSGFVNNFSYGQISLTSNTSVELVNQTHNTTSTSPEAVYANELVVAAGATLNLNGLHLYVRGDQISGTVLGGTVIVVPAGGAISLGTPTPGTLTPAGAIQQWKFYGTAGESISIQLNPGGTGSNPAVAPFLDWGQVSLLNSSGSSLASGSSASSGAFATISSFVLPSSGTYTVQVQAPSAESASTGNYVLSVYNVTPYVTTLSVNQEYTGTVGTAFGVNQYDFTAAAGVQVQLDVINVSGGVEFDLTGTGGFAGFTNITASSGLVTLPAAGSYVLTAHGNGAQGGSYAFALDQTSVSNLTLGTPSSGTLEGSGQAQLFRGECQFHSIARGLSERQHCERCQSGLRQPGHASNPDELRLPLY